VDIKVARVYEDPGRDQDDYRVLVDRLWPRGVSKAMIDIDEWVKILAPSNTLRKYYNHDISKYKEFVALYYEELNNPLPMEKLIELNAIARKKKVILLTATKDIEHSAAFVLANYLSEMIK
jgi:uncharacterized protein YeaO (DUF488 family)